MTALRSTASARSGRSAKPRVVEDAPHGREEVRPQVKGQVGEGLAGQGGQSAVADAQGRAAAARHGPAGAGADGQLAVAGLAGPISWKFIRRSLRRRSGPRTRLAPLPDEADDVIFLADVVVPEFLSRRKFSILPLEETWVRVPVQGMVCGPMEIVFSPQGESGTSWAMMARTFFSSSSRSTFAVPEVQDEALADVGVQRRDSGSCSPARGQCR